MTTSMGAGHEARAGTGLRKRLAVGVMALGVVASGTAVVTLGASPASAANAAFRAGIPVPDSWIGSYTLPGLNGAGSEVVYCGANSVPFYPNADAGFYDGGSDVFSGEDYAIAYAMSRYGDDGSVENPAAVDGLVSLHNPDGTTHDYQSALQLGLGDRMDAIWADSVAHAGPWTITFDGVNANNDNNNFKPNTNYVGTVHLQGPNGPITGVNINLGISGGAAVSPGTVTTDGAGNAQFNWSSAVSSFQVTGYAHNPVLRRWAGPNDAQPVVGLSVTGDMSGTSAGHTDPFVEMSWFKYTTGDPSQTPVAGAVFNITNMSTGADYGNFTSGNGPSAFGGQEIFSGDTIRFSEITPPPGHYMDGSPPFDIVVPQGVTAFAVGVPNRANPKVEISSSVQSGLVTIGLPLVDNVVITGNDGQNGTITDLLYFVAKPAGTTLSDCQGISDEAYRAGTQIGSYSAAVNGSVNGGNGTTTITGPVGDKLGCYHWFESVTLTPSGATANGSANQDSETVVVTTPVITTAVQDGLVTIGLPLIDNATVAGNLGENGTITNQLYYVPAAANATLDTCKNISDTAYKAGTLVGTYTAAIDGSVNNGNGTVKVTGPKADKLGCYHWFESMVLTPSGATATGPANQVSESVLVTKPSITTAVQDELVTIGLPLIDNATVAGNLGENGTITNDLYYVAAPANATLDTCQGISDAAYKAGTKVGTYTAPIDGSSNNGNGTVKVTGPKADKLGCYHWFESMVLTPSGATATGPENQVSESLLVTKPSITTAVQKAIINIGLPLVDNAVVSANLGENGTISNDLYFVPAPANATLDTCRDISDAKYKAGTLVGTYTAQIDGSVNNGNGTIPVTGPVADKIGCYHWFESLVLTPSGATAVGPENQVTESLLVTTPSIKSAAVTPELVINRPLVDTVTVSANNGESGTITDALYYVAAPADADLDFCQSITDAGYKAGTLVGTYTAPLNGAVGNGNGDVTVTGPIADKIGCYHWFESLVLTPSGATAVGPANQAAESVLVTIPAITTQVNLELAQTGQRLDDTATVVGNDGADFTITADVYMVEAPEGADVEYCQGITDEDYLAGTKIGTYTTDVEAGEGDGNGDFVIEGPIVELPGCYHWFETAEFSTGTVIEGPENQVTESTLVTQPAIKTQVNQQVGAPGDVLKDTIMVTGVSEVPSTPGGKVDVHLFYKPFDTDVEKCADITTKQWAEFIEAHPESEVFTQTIDIEDDGDLISDGYTVPEGAIGCYTFTEGYTPPFGTETVVVTEPGEVTETTTIISPKVSTVMASTDEDTKTSFVDTAVVTGTHGIPVILKVDLLGPVASANGTDCLGLDFSNAAVAGSFTEIQVLADGSYITNSIAFDKADVAQCYVGYESLYLVKGPEKTTPEKIYQGEKGVVTELGFSTLRNRGGAGATGIDTGNANDGGPSLVLIGGGVAGLLLAAAGTAIALKRRRTAE